MIGVEARGTTPVRVRVRGSDRSELTPFFCFDSGCVPALPLFLQLYNLCSERFYDIAGKFEGRGSRYGFDDHNPSVRAGKTAEY